jgi:phosphatidylinositol alpha-1,6-mannosyltransferase
MTHLLVITNDFGPRQGGIESFVHALLERMPHASFTVFTSRQDGADAFDREFTRRTGARVVRDRAKVLLPSPRVARAAATLAVDVAATSVWFGAAAPLGLLAPRLRRAGVGTIVATTHGHEVWWSRVPLMRSAIRRIGSSVDVLTYLGEFTRSAIAPALRPADRSKLRPLAP